VFNTRRDAPPPPSRKPLTGDKRSRSQSLQEATITPSSSDSLDVSVIVLSRSIGYASIEVTISNEQSQVV